MGAVLVTVGTACWWTMHRAVALQGHGEKVDAE